MRVLLCSAGETGRLLGLALKRIGHDVRQLDRFALPPDWRPDVIHFLGTAPDGFDPSDPLFNRTAIIGAGMVTDLRALDQRLWDPAADRRIVRRYNRNTLSLKMFNKEALQSRHGLPVDPAMPLLGLLNDRPVTVPDRFKFQLSQLPADDPMLYAGCDLVLVGEDETADMIACRYGAAPVRDEKELERMLETYRDAACWDKLRQEIMAIDNSWDALAKRCLAVYVRELGKKIK